MKITIVDVVNGKTLDQSDTAISKVVYFYSHSFQLTTGDIILGDYKVLSCGIYPTQNEILINVHPTRA